MEKISNAKIGDIFQIPLSGKKKVYGQYVFFDKKNGPIIRIFDYFTIGDQLPDLKKIQPQSLLFPPLFAGIKGAINSGIWKIVGTLPSDDYTYSGFLSNISDISPNRQDPVRIKKWFFWDGNISTELGEHLPEKYQAYESTAVYPPDMIVQRIETGFDMFAYPKKHNRFLTKEEIKDMYPQIEIE